MKRWMIWTTILIATAVIGTAAYLGYRQAQTAVPVSTPDPVTVAVTQGTVQHTVTA
ncbi:MAG: hypothetical protein GY943_06655, partial [Chloroflexi bacterium]|nr:hypothetical protein [Chloroflexota bacterium]